MGSKLLTPDWKKWLLGCLKHGDTPIKLPTGLTLGALTGQDQRALSAIASCWELYAVSDDDGRRGALFAVRALLPAMQAQCRPFAKELIAYAMDWDDRERLWPMVTRPDLKLVPELGDQLAALDAARAAHAKHFGGDK